MSNQLSFIGGLLAMGRKLKIVCREISRRSSLSDETAIGVGAVAVGRLHRYEPSFTDMQSDANSSGKGPLTTAAGAVGFRRFAYVISSPCREGPGVGMCRLQSRSMTLVRC